MVEFGLELTDTPEQALVQGKMKGMLLICYEHERPFQSTLGELDWRFNGHFTQLLKKQVITGQKGETVYCPLLWNENFFHFVIVGGGSEYSSDLLALGKKKIKELNLSQIGIQARDWNREGQSLWVS